MFAFLKRAVPEDDVSLLEDVIPFDVERVSGSR